MHTFRESEDDKHLKNMQWFIVKNRQTLISFNRNINLKASTSHHHFVSMLDQEESQTQMLEGRRQ